MATRARRHFGPRSRVWGVHGRVSRTSEPAPAQAAPVHPVLRARLRTKPHAHVLSTSATLRAFELDSTVANPDFHHRKDLIDAAARECFDLRGKYRRAGAGVLAPQVRLRCDRGRAWSNRAPWRSPD